MRMGGSTGGRAVNWSIGIFSGDNPTLPECVRLVEQNGVTPIVQKGAWLDLARALSETASDGVVLISDAMGLSPGAIDYLDRLAWPPGCGAISLLAPKPYVQRHHVYSGTDLRADLPGLGEAQRQAKECRGRVVSVPRRPGLIRITSASWRQFRALAFPRDVLRSLLSDSELPNDLGQTLSRRRLRLYTVHPGLAGHLDGKDARKFYPQATDPLKDCVDHNSLEFSSYADLAEIIRKWAPTLPNDISCVSGIPRSGLTPAAMLALHLHVPLVPIESIIHPEFPAYRPKRTKRTLRQLTDRPGKPLILDDTVSKGGSIQEVKSQIPIPAYYGAVWVRESSRHLVDFWAADHAFYHHFEWNWWATTLTEHCVCDMDGVLCEDWSGNEEQEPERYQKHLTSAKPLYIPKSPIQAVVTSRFERHRSSTEAWLKRHGVRYGRLIMEPDDRPRRFADHKATAYEQLLDAKLFVESSLKQAQRIFEKTGRPVLSIERSQFFRTR